MNKYVRILIISLEYPAFADGGYGIICKQVCEWLRQRGHDVLVLTAIPTSTTTYIPDEAGEVPVRRTLHSYWDGSECLYPSFSESLAIEQANQGQLRAALTDFRPEVVSFWHMGALSLGLITTTAQLKLPIVFVIADDWLHYGRWADGWMRRFMYHPLRAARVEQLTGVPTHLPDVGSVGAFCFASDFTRGRAEQIANWRFHRFGITPPGISLAEFPPLDSLPERPWRWRLLWIGRVIESKGVMTAIKALALLPREATLDIVGPVAADFRARLEALAVSYGVAERLSFMLASRQEVRSRYLHTDVTLFTSAIEHEAFGLVPLEAMASACPVISTCIGGSGEYCLDGVNCLRIPQENPEALAAAVQRLADNPDLRRLLAEGGLRTASEFTLDRMAERIEQCLLTEASLP